MAEMFMKEQVKSKIYILQQDGREAEVIIKLQRFLNLRYWSTGGGT